MYTIKQAMPSRIKINFEEKLIIKSKLTALPLPPYLLIHIYKLYNMRIVVRKTKNPQNHKITFFCDLEIVRFSYCEYRHNASSAFD